MGATKGSGCAICGKPTARGQAATVTVVDGRKRTVDPFPFCSARCQLINLGKWLSDDYRVPDRDTVVWPVSEDGKPDDDV